MKTKKELNILNEKVNEQSKKVSELREEELSQVIGGAMIVNHNMAAINELTQLSKNQQSLSKL